MRTLIKKGMLFALLVILITFTHAEQSYSQNYWVELQPAYHYRDNDFYITGFNAYHLILAEIRTGFRISHRKLPAGLESYITAYPVKDVATDIWNEVDWHNNVVYGFGARLRFNPGVLLFVQPREFNVDLFTEWVRIHYFPNELFFTGHRPTEDLKSGIRVWLALGQSKNSENSTHSHKYSLYFWLDYAGAFYYAKSSFFARSQSGFYLLDMQSRLGPALKFSRIWPVELYFTSQFIMDVGQNTWNELDWHNRVRFGPGARIRYSRFPRPEPGKWNIVFTPYIEYLWIRYLKKVPYVPSYRPHGDFQIGLTMWLSYAQKR